MHSENAEVASALPSPAALAQRLPRTPAAAATVERGRSALRDALHGKDPRFVVIVGPCSIHGAGDALDYARRLARLAHELGDVLTLVMRTYFEKPRSALGWKGLISDPHLDGSCDLALGVARAREILCAVNELGVPCASEILDPIVRHYICDLLAWACIGARTSESQIHREMASGLPLPVGVKNPTSGELAPAVDALLAARSPHRHLGVGADGGFVRVETSGNPDVHLVLRGGARGPNFRPADVARAAQLVAPFALARPILVDCSHGNSGKDPGRQPAVLRALLAQFEAPETPLLGAMLESHLEAGRQSLVPGAAPAYGVSLTDACLGWDATEALLREAAGRLR
ncbi:MAG TPA: 3-deoxy-7-phosphoheptulonate synthase [Myxococcota bacterium]|nr:3-deoxy-7-phosphoheptulonate synthase [Myxococcota bacterium]